MKNIEMKRFSKDNDKVYLTINEMTYLDHNIDLLVHKFDRLNVIAFV
jgi:hypothetical protein